MTDAVGQVIELVKAGRLGQTGHSREWYEARLEGFGGTDAPVLLGLSRWRTARDVVEEKIRRVIPDAPERLRLRLGRELEPILIRHAAELARERGLVEPMARLWRPAEDRVFTSKADPFVFAHPDGFHGDAMLELKTDAFGYEPWGDEEGEPSRVVPPMYYAQVQHGLAATGRGRAFLFVLIGLNDRKLYEIPRDDDFIADLIEAESEQWIRVEWGRRRLANDPDAELDDLLPDLDGSAAASAWLKRRYPSDEDEIILPASAEQEQLIAQLRDAVRQTAVDELFEDQLKNRLKDVIGEHAGISSRLGTITWRKSKDGEVVAWEIVADVFRRLLEAVDGPELRMRLAAYGVSTSGPIGNVLDAIVSLHSGTRAGARVFRTPRAWAKADSAGE